MNTDELKVWKMKFPNGKYKGDTVEEILQFDPCYVKWYADFCAKGDFSDRLDDIHSEILDAVVEYIR